jgi:hypothetical protein
MVHRCNLAEVEGDGVANLCEFAYASFVCPSSRGCPWWLYICSQLGFKMFLAFYSKSVCWALRASCILRVGFSPGPKTR